MSEDGVPLCVHLDTTLTPVNIRHEFLLGLCRQSPARILLFPLWLIRGRRYFHRQVAAHVRFDVETLPVRQRVVEWLAEKQEKGQLLILVTTLDATVADRFAARVGIFDDVLALEAFSGDDVPAVSLVERFGERGYDYLGDDPVDADVWKSARRRLRLSDSRPRATAERPADVGPSRDPGTWRVWLTALRLHQWVKNVLVFLPALLAHRIAEPDIMFASTLAFIAFCLCASSVYVVNDLLDLDADRRHPRKKTRPFASGALTARQGAVAASALLVAAALTAVAVNFWFLVVIASYYAFTWIYTLRLKRAAVVDVMALAGIYTIRIIAGAAATGIEPSFWLLAFSVFIFLSLGIVKRFAELDGMGHAGGSGHGRGYSKEDLSLLMSLGIASAYSAVVVMALYINSPDSQALYRHSRPMWLICPLMLYWISRIWLLTSRGQMEDDPVVFALRDRISISVLGLIGLVVFVSL